ncbi:MAG: hypothetical protein IPP35_10380 [Elusimicrobia bacterium]|nr:hypothetical protein [Elusimicrobiota bacterium]
MEHDYYQFRHLSVDDAVLFGFNAWTARMAVWLACGIALGPVHHVLLNALGEKGYVSLFVRILEALLLSALPLQVASRAATEYQEEKDGGFWGLVRPGNLVVLALCIYTLFFLALVGALSINGLVEAAFWYFFNNDVNLLWRDLLAPIKVLPSMTAYPLLIFGGMLFGARYSFIPFVAIHEGGGFFNAVKRGRELAQELVFAMIFLHGALFITVSLSFLVAAVLSNEATLLNRTAESCLITLAVSFTACVWNHAYRQALFFDKKQRRLGPTGKTLFVIQ